LGALAGLTAGLGYGMEFTGVSLGLDYAFVPFGDLGISHRIGLTGDFGAKSKMVPEKEPAPAQPIGLQATAGDRRAQLYWRPNADPVGGYNVYLAYKLAGPWYKLTPRPVQVTSQSVGSLYNNVTTYLVVTAVNAKDPSVESKKSIAVMAVPRAAGTVAVPQYRAPATPAKPGAAKPSVPSSKPPAAAAPRRK
jgi:hypothetical protein